eukprot:gene9345-11250_t
MMFASHPLTYGHAFGVLYAMYAFWAATALTHVVATSHYEPQPLAGRVAKHGR